MYRKIRIIYIAYDEMEFDSKQECIKYERSNKRIEQENLLGCWLMNATKEKQISYRKFTKDKNISGSLDQITDKDLATIIKWCRKNNPK